MRIVDGDVITEFCMAIREMWACDSSVDWSSLSWLAAC